MSESHDENPDAAPEIDSSYEDGTARRRGLRMLATAVVCLGIFALGTYGVQALSTGATVIVEADEIATVLMKTGGVRLEEIDGPLVIALHPGRNAVRAGKFRVVGDIEGVRLDFSTGEMLQINKDDEISLEIESIPLQDKSDDAVPP